MTCSSLWRDPICCGFDGLEVKFAFAWLIGLERNLSKHTYRKYIEFLALCLLAVALLWFFGRKLNWTEVRTAVSHANPTLLVVAVFIIFLSYLIRALRWGVSQTIGGDDCETSCSTTIGLAQCS